MPYAYLQREREPERAELVALAVLARRHEAARRAKQRDGRGLG